MQCVRLQEVAGHRTRPGGDLPFELGGQPRTSPARKGVGFVVADVADRLVQARPAAFLRWCNSTIRRRAAPNTAARSTGCCERSPIRPTATTVDCCSRHPARSPDTRRWSTSREARRKGLQIYVVTRTFVVERKAAALEADGINTLGKAMPLERRDGDFVRCQVLRFDAIGRTKRIRPQAVLHVGDDQFLMLLLMIDTELDELGSGLRKLQRQQMNHGFVDVDPISVYLVEAGSRQGMPQSAQGTVADRVVIGVKEIAERGMIRADSRPCTATERMSRRTRWCEPGATSPGWRRAWAADCGPQLRAARRSSARSRRSPRYCCSKEASSGHIAVPEAELSIVPGSNRPCHKSSEMQRT